MKTMALLALAAATTALPASYIEANEGLLWTNFKQTYKKTYSGADETSRRAIFKRNMLKAAELEKTNPQAQFGMSPFADLSEEEFKVYHNLDASKKVLPPAPVNMFTEAEVKAATSVDWRTRGAVTPIKNQGQCGSCWAFSTTGNIEGQNFLAGNKLTSLSEQELVSCGPQPLGGCNGGWQDDAFAWLQKAHGGAIVTEASYSYTSGQGVSGTCFYKSSMPVGATIASHADLPKNEDQMATWCSTRGPIAIVIDATSWMTYQSGVLTNCISNNVDHAVLVVGYTADYWIVKNSWGTTWGESGYIRLAKGTNQCLITYRPTSSHVVKKN